ncbi:MAG: hypothetical protein QNJ88_06925 [Acidimicrobiia bacterium]|nr:hypothetical protein [Acidimicrobiia bacterium]
MSSRRLLTAVALVTTVVVGSTPAAADEVSLPELAELAAAAAGGDEAARREISAVTSVDGSPVDGAGLLSGDAAAVETRLRTLADRDTPPSAIDADQARSEAASILEGREYQRAEPSPPGWLQRFSEWLAGLVPDEIGQILSSPTLWILVAVLAVATVAFFLLRNAARRRRHDAGSDGPSLGTVARTAADLERRAQRAADAGDYGMAVRLWFEAGALRLADRGAVPRDTTSTSGAIRRAVPTATMAELTTTFDRVAYGQRHATSHDAQAAEQGWGRVIEELSAHG